MISPIIATLQFSHLLRLSEHLKSWFTYQPLRKIDFPISPAREIEAKVLTFEEC
jgi:hypothetical protein